MRRRCTQPSGRRRLSTRCGRRSLRGGARDGCTKKDLLDVQKPGCMEGRSFGKVVRRPGEFPQRLKAFRLSHYPPSRLPRPLRIALPAVLRHAVMTITPLAHLRLVSLLALPQKDGQAGAHQAPARRARPRRLAARRAELGRPDGFARFVADPDLDRPSTAIPGRCWPRRTRTSELEQLTGASTAGGPAAYQDRPLRSALRDPGAPPVASGASTAKGTRRF